MRKAKNKAEGALFATGAAAPSMPRPRDGARSTGLRPKASERRPGARDPARRRRDSASVAAKRVAESRRPSSAEEMLDRAMHAATPRARGIWARRGLALPTRIDRTTQSMLLRQLYLTHYEERRFGKALEVAEQIIVLRVLPDVAHQDAARAKQALGDVEGAAGHLRLAARIGPARRKAFHWWTLGSLYYLAQRYDDAIGAITRAARWGTTDKPLYLGHLAVVRCASGQRVDDLPALIERLSEAPAGQGYGRFVLGQLAFYERRWDDARRWLEAFVRRSSGGRAALAIALGGEIDLARRTLASLGKN